MYDLETNFYHSMDTVGRYPGRTPNNVVHSHRLEGIAAQKTLPSFRDIIPPHLHEQIDSNPQSAASDFQSADASMSGAHSGVSTNRSVAPSPAPSQHGSLQMVGDGYNTYPNRHDAAYLNQQSSQRMPDHAPTWVPSTSYSDVNMAILPHQTSHGTQISPTSRASPGLPSIRDIHARTETLKQPNGYDTSYGMPQDQYQAMYNVGQIAQPEFENGHYVSRRSGQVDPMRRHQQNYFNTNRHYGQAMAEVPRYWDGNYHQMRTQMPYQNRFSEVDYSPHAMHAPPSTFGLIGDPDRTVPPKRRRGNLPKPVTDLLKQWLLDHLDHPYPTEEDKQWFIAQTGLSISQISNWFINARRRQVPSIKSNLERPSQGSVAEHRNVERLRSHESSLSPQSDTGHS